MSKLYKNKGSYTISVNDKFSGIVNSIYSPKKSDSLRVADLMNDKVKRYNYSVDHSRALRMKQCGDYLQFASPISQEDGTIKYKKSKVAKAYLCRDRFCPMCQYRQSKRNQYNLSRVVGLLSDCGYRFLFLTLTIPNCKGSEIRQTITYLNKSWFRFYHLKAVKSAWLGYYKTVEITYNKKTNTYHPHLHFLVVVDKSYFKNNNKNNIYLTHDRISQLWAKCNKKLIEEYNKNHSNELNRLQVNIKSVKNMQSAIYELSKYCCKSVHITEHTIEDVITGLNGLRMFEYIGLFKETYQKLKLNEKSTDDIDEEDIYLITHWNFKNNNYVINEEKTSILKGKQLFMKGG